jgi:hypothetical protein
MAKINETTIEHAEGDHYLERRTNGTDPDWQEFWYGNKKSGKTTFLANEKHKAVDYYNLLRRHDFTHKAKGNRLPKEEKELEREEGVQESNINELSTNMLKHVRAKELEDLTTSAYRAGDANGRPFMQKHKEKKIARVTRRLAAIDKLDQKIEKRASVKENEELNSNFYSLIQATIQEKPLEFKEAFQIIIGPKVADAILSLKEEIRQEMFVEKEVEVDDEDDKTINTESVSILSSYAKKK